MDVATCLAEQVAGLVQPDGRGAGTPGGDAAIAFLVASLEGYGLAAPLSGRLQTFDLSTRRASGQGEIAWNDAALLAAPSPVDDLDRFVERRVRAAGDGWEIVDGSAPGYLPQVHIGDAGTANSKRAIVGPGGVYPLAWIVRDEIPVGDVWHPMLHVDPSLELALGRRAFDLTVWPAIVTSSNVFAWVPGAGALAAEVVLIGAHHDHLASLGPHVFPGADDNASGAAATLCALAAYQAALPAGDRRAVLGVWFGGEEDGLWGSQTFVAAPIVPLEAISGVLVLDMIGRLHGDSLDVKGHRASTWVERLSDAAETHDLGLTAALSAGMSDEASFEPLGIPSAHFYTGQHGDYHAPTDTPDRLDWVGLERITRFTADGLARLTTGKVPPGGRVTDVGIRLGGVAPGGAPIVGAVIPGSPAALHGVQPGHRVTDCGGRTLVEPVAWLHGTSLWSCVFTPAP